MKILAFAATSSSKSINKQLVRYAAGQFENADTEVIDINDYELPIYSEDKEAELGQPDLAKDFFEKIGDSDAVIIAFAEHNYSYAVAYKNIFDWASRINMKVYQNKPMLLLATSPGPGGAAGGLAMATESAPHFGGDVKASISVPSFHDNFDSALGLITNAEINAQLLSAVTALRNSVLPEETQPA